jgi:spore coat polysaccharide biosynthesis protein SpsF
LPGKVLAPLAGVPALLRIVERLGLASSLDAVVVVVPDGPVDEPLRGLCDAHGIDWHAGSERDVLDRFHGALERFAPRAELVVRITADCPFVDPAIIDRLVALHRRRAVDYSSVATGALPRSSGLRRYPDGLDAEAMTPDGLRVAWRDAEDPYEREHVTPFLYGRPDRFRLARLEAPDDRGAERWTVDYPEDLEFVQAVYERLGPRMAYDDILDLLDREPELRRINALRAVEQR